MGQQQSNPEIEVLDVAMNLEPKNFDQSIMGQQQSDQRIEGFNAERDLDPQ